ncbi:magnesium and cobalt transport protein CorA [Olleya aquimaris]|uniref:Magnesium transport protein CorA n=1 Tax=Olleya sediminilitoris TaxID=2795739 RepID=A0ABS1WJW5_9FLAO|nr:MULTISPECIES: magnesium/cobalt transporter CorA [Olleya]AXO79751.1 magnesium and cobalt transport protein CorA [Olleya aquimaris]MBL7559415.1 magnesium/cobalt transporter CorA [Olleya sediminilitoris]
MAKKRQKKRTQNYKKHLGQVPGALVYTGAKDNKQLQLHAFDYNEHDYKEADLSSVEEAFRFKDSETVTWFNLNGLNFINQIEKIGQHYNLHPLILEDIVNTSQRPKIDEYKDYFFIVLKMMYYDESEKIVSEQVSMVMGKNYVLTFQEAEGDVFNGLRERIRHKKGRIRDEGSDYLLYALIDAIVDHYYAIIETMGNKIEDLEDDLFTGLTQEEISQQIQNLKREILKIRRAIFPLREIINRLEKSEGPLIEEKTTHYFRDVYDHIIQVTENIDIYREMIWSLMDMYMTTISNKMNEVMKVLTIMATIFIPLTFIAGVYGMNFKNMPELENPDGYYIVWIVMIAIFIGMVVYFKRKKWL